MSELQRSGEMPTGLRVKVKEAYRRKGYTFTNLDRSNISTILLEQEGAWAVFDRITGEVFNLFPVAPTNTHGWSPARSNASRKANEIIKAGGEPDVHPSEYDAVA